MHFTFTVEGPKLSGDVVGRSTKRLGTPALPVCPAPEGVLQYTEAENKNKIYKNCKHSTNHYYICAFRWTTCTQWVSTEHVTD